MIAADPLGAIVAFLEDQEIITDQVHDRIYSGQLPRDQAAGQPQKAIVVQASGGEGNSNDYTPLTKQRFDMFCYGGTLNEADLLRRQVYLLLKQLRPQVVANTLLRSVVDAGGLILTRDPDSNWPVAWQSFQLFYNDVEVIENA